MSRPCKARSKMSNSSVLRIWVYRTRRFRSAPGKAPTSNSTAASQSASVHLPTGRMYGLLDGSWTDLRKDRPSKILGFSCFWIAAPQFQPVFTGRGRIKNAKSTVFIESWTDGRIKHGMVPPSSSLELKVASANWSLRFGMESRLQPVLPSLVLVLVLRPRF